MRSEVVTCQSLSTRYYALHVYFEGSTGLTFVYKSRLAGNISLVRALSRQLVVSSAAITGAYGRQVLAAALHSFDLDARIGRGAREETGALRLPLEQCGLQERRQGEKEGLRLLKQARGAGDLRHALG